MGLSILGKGNSLIQDKLTRLRDRSTLSEEFKRHIEDLTTILAFEAFRDLRTANRSVVTPKNRTTLQPVVAEDEEVLILSLFRAAVPMAHKVKTLLPKAGIIHVVYRDKEIVDVKEVPEGGDGFFAKSRCIIVDPIIGTGNSIIKLIGFLEQQGVSPVNLPVLCIASATSGVTAILDRYDSVAIYSLVEERELFQDGYLDPGFGDVGNRIYGLYKE